MLVRWFASSWHFDDAEAALSTITPDLEHIQGAAAIAYAYLSAGRITEAIALYEKVLTDSTRILGQDHPHTLTSRNNLAGAYRETGRITEAIALYEKVLTDRTRILGKDHPATLETLNALAGAYKDAGFLNKATALLEGETTPEG